jgi:homoserine kinase
MFELSAGDFNIKIPGSTSNLGAGFDTAGLALQIYLTVTVRKADIFALHLTGEGSEALPSNESNLLVQTYLQVCEHFNLKPQAFDLRVHNEIPLQRGLGSSGAAIAAGLKLAKQQAGETLPVQALLELGCQIEGHPENLVASFLGGFSVNCFSGRRLTCKHFQHIPSLQAVLLIPDFTISTEAARKLLPSNVSFADAVANVQRCGLLVAALTNGDFSLLREAVTDRLHQPFRKKLIPGFDDILNAAYEGGAHAVFLSGSGSTILALTNRNADAIAQAMQSVVQTQSYAATTKIVEIDTKGARVEN